MLATVYFIFAALHLLAAGASAVEAAKGQPGNVFAVIVLAVTSGLLIAAGLAL